ncbi:COMM domain-containing protein 6 [Acipenser ruthenus]|uniref:COMM domain-containing protein 6 n=1 Tax=Acipenser ruthenus TaxID=7906 RepID=A0A444UMU4_ACIRT|nr:COMM domain-containing protein 6 [Acipenser ruthenus]
MITVGQLVDFQWKLAMAISSDTCRSLNYPYISMTLKVANSSGQITSKSFEMTIPQFQVSVVVWCGLLPRTCLQSLHV